MSEINLRFLPEIPVGWRIWDADIQVAGTNFRIDDAIAFARGENQSLVLEPEPTNQHDPNAVKVLGLAQSMGLVRQFFLGYIAKEVAKNLPPKFEPRLKNIWVGGHHQPVVHIRFDLLVPKEAKQSDQPKQTRSKTKSYPPVERPPLLQSLYLPNDSDGPPSRIYCEKCKQPHLDVDCPICGNDHRGATLSGCMYCRTDFGGSRKNCPVCTVEQLLDKAQSASMSGNLPKAIELWRTAHQEACTNRFDFSCRDYFSYACYLGEAGFAGDAMKLLKELRAYLGQVLAASPRSNVDYYKYFHSMAETHQTMAKAMSLDPTPKTQTRQKGIVFHGVLHQLYCQCDTHHSGYGVDSSHVASIPTSAYYTNRMKEILRRAKLNKGARSEQLQQVFAKHWQTVPEINTDAVRDDIVELVESW